MSIRLQIGNSEKSQYKLQQVLVIYLLLAYSGNWQTDSKIYIERKRPTVPRAILRKNRAEQLVLPQIRSYYKTRMVK